MNPSTRPRVSVVTATRNRPHWLRQALLTVKRQSLADFEAIVVDDGSAPEVQQQYEEIWKELDERFVLHRRNPPGGCGSDPGSGRNHGWKQARSEFVAFLDHDDLWLSPDHLEVGVRALAQANADYYFTHARQEPAEGPRLPWIMPPEYGPAAPAIVAGADVVDMPLRTFLRHMQQYSVHPSHSIVRHRLLVETEGFIERLRTADDINFMLRAADKARRILYRRDCVVAIRLPEGTSYSLASGSLEQTLAGHHAMLDARLRCRNRAVKRCARAREGWNYRELAELQLAGGSRPEAWLLARQAFATWPSAGAALFLAKTALAILRRACGGVATDMSRAKRQEIVEGV
jgi:glycosyltransferase involved in cell wall biosynthesis